MNKAKNNRSLKLSISGMLIALGVILSTFYIPFGVAKCFPIQHFINVIGAVLLGPAYAVINAFLISLIRNMLGMGSLLAFPGSMIGAALAGFLYQRFSNQGFSNHRMACLGEVMGTGIGGSMIAAPVASYLMGNHVGLFFFIIPFGISSLVGSVFSLIILEATDILKPMRKWKEKI
ncbi:energy coupling factor transporter S component ThiW [Petrocella sp. FN5]|uniref:energy coupling factor transporter S component ThiW n=1 Tax=Petrocella sp. FN5 TaxID=3032002 RepID=UPI0023DA9CFD|nr:energy coupling factor transporter S component ThiW [Petrocella sp. FN5]MDF1618498.1 energy coupling factor transporter S component ThiW [Petrocella sp. FN5]